jgi:hypothetical protein
MAGKGDRFRKVDKKKYDENFERVFGIKKFNIMSNEDRKELIYDRDGKIGRNISSDRYDSGNIYETCQDASGQKRRSKTKTKTETFWTGPGYRGEYSCPHGVGHGNHIHGCCQERCCTREDFPPRKK